MIGGSNDDRFSFGRGVDASPKIAADWLRKAAAGGRSSAADVNLGLFYNFGIGVTRDLAQATEHFFKAALVVEDIEDVSLRAANEDVDGDLAAAEEARP